MGKGNGDIFILPGIHSLVMGEHLLLKTELLRHKKKRKRVRKDSKGCLQLASLNFIHEAFWVHLGWSMSSPLVACTGPFGLVHE